MTDPIEDLIGDYRAFAAQQRDRLLSLGIDIAPYELSHIAYRVPSGTSTFASGHSWSATRAPIVKMCGMAARSR